MWAKLESDIDYTVSLALDSDSFADKKLATSTGITHDNLPLWVEKKKFFEARKRVVLSKDTILNKLFRVDPTR